MDSSEYPKEIIQTIQRLSIYSGILGILIVPCLIWILILSLNQNYHSPPGLMESQNLATGKPQVYSENKSKEPQKEAFIPWKAPDTSQIPSGEQGKMIRYGKDLIAHTARYYGPHGTIAPLSNGLNCQNCHLEGGTRIYGNNFSIFYSSYPKISNRSGKWSPPSQRIVECMQRSLAGVSADTNSREVKSMLAYMKWIGQGVKKKEKLFGTASEKLPFLEVAADPEKGKRVYEERCQSCHGDQGQGVWSQSFNEYTYPPLWGKNSFNDGAGMYRIINMAGFIKNNMPWGATYTKPQLSNEEAWNVAAFIESQPRNHYDQSKDWKDLTKKPIDLPFGPYLDRISEKQHKFGPFKPILEAQNKFIAKI